MTIREPLPRLLTIDELAEQLGTTPRHIRRLVAERRIPFLKVGWFIRFDLADLARWLDACRHDASVGSTPRVGRSYAASPDGDRDGRRTTG